MTEHKIDLSLLASARDGTGHSIFSPSSSAMWLTCSGSLVPNILANDDAGEDAAYGTVAHELTEQQLKTHQAPTHRLGERVWIESGDWGFLITIDEEMLGYVQQAVDYCEWVPGYHFVEQRVFFSEYTPLERQSGTADHVACAPGIMTITDHKFGKGVKVYAAENAKDKRAIIESVDGTIHLNGNSQGLLYALGFFLKHDHKYHFERIVIRISQPRLEHWDEWETTRAELLKFAEWVKVRAAAAWQLNAPRRPSPKGCQWCKVKGDCAALAVQQESIMSAAFANLAEDVSVTTMEDLKERLADPLGSYEMRIRKADRLTTEEMAALYGYRRIAEAWWNQLAKTLFERAAAGEHVPGWKLVESRSRRAFKSKAEATEKLIALGLKRSEIVEEKMVSPAQAEALLKKHGTRAKDIPPLLKDLVFKPPGAATLAPVKDKRPALEDLSGIAFGDTATNPETDE